MITPGCTRLELLQLSPLSKAEVLLGDVMSLIVRYRVLIVLIVPIVLSIGTSLVFSLCALRISTQQYSRTPTLLFLTNTTTIDITLHELYLRTTTHNRTRYLRMYTVWEPS